jgi:hypothetical protein
MKKKKFNWDAIARNIEKKITKNISIFKFCKRYDKKKRQFKGYKQITQDHETFIFLF